jgi:hypothetical protein
MEQRLSMEDKPSIRHLFQRYSEKHMRIDSKLKELSFNRSTDVSEALWRKAFHVIAVIAWMAGTL